MGRPRKHNLHLPPNVQPKHGAYYYTKGPWKLLGHTLTAALKAYAERFESANGGIDELVNRTLKALSTRTSRPLSKNTKAQYGIAANKIKKIFAEFHDPRDVKQKHIFALRAGLSATPNMANRVLSFTRQVFDQAAQEGIIDSNPALGVGRLDEKKRDRLLALEEIAAIREHAGPRLRVIIDLLLHTGQRINDVLAIRRSDLTDDGIEFRQQKTGAKVLVRWTPELEAVVKAAKALYGNVTAFTLLHNRRGKRPDYSTVKIQWDKARKAAGVEDATLHDLRAVSATWARRQGKDATALLGHTSSAQTKRYLRDRDHTFADGPSFRHLLDSGKK